MSCTTELGGLYYTVFELFGPCVLCMLSFNGFNFRLCAYVLNLKGLLFQPVCVCIKYNVFVPISVCLLYCSAQEMF